MSQYLNLSTYFPITLRNITLLHFKVQYPFSSSVSLKMMIHANFFIYSSKSSSYPKLVFDEYFFTAKHANSYFLTLTFFIINICQFLLKTHINSLLFLTAIYHDLAFGIKFAQEVVPTFSISFSPVQ